MRLRCTFQDSFPLLLVVDPEELRRIAAVLVDVRKRDNKEGLCRITLVKIGDETLLPLNPL